MKQWQKHEWLDMYGNWQPFVSFTQWDLAKHWNQTIRRIPKEKRHGKTA